MSRSKRSAAVHAEDDEIDRLLLGNPQDLAMRFTIRVSGRPCRVRVRSAWDSLAIQLLGEFQADGALIRRDLWRH